MIRSRTAIPDAARMLMDLVVTEIISERRAQVILTMHYQLTDAGAMDMLRRARPHKGAK